MPAADWMSLAEWVVAFRELHEQARRGKLDARELERYEEEREALAKALLVAQCLAVKPGMTARRTLRVTRALPVELKLGNRTEKAVTLDLALGAFAVMLAKPSRVDERIEFVLALKEGAPLSGRARVVNLQRKGKPYRVAFAFEDLSTVDAQRVRFEIFDAVLARISPP